MSDPSATGAKPAATAAADPPLDPPGTRDVSRGLRVGPNAEFSVLEPIANSSRFVLPIRTAPASRSRPTIVASYGGFQPSRILDEQVVGIPCVHMLSFERDRHAGEASRVAAGRDGLVDRRCLLAGEVGGDDVERVDVGVAGVDRGQVPFEHVGRTHGARADLRGDVGRGGRRVG